MMEYPEVVCMRDQMREALISKRIGRGKQGICARKDDNL